MPRNTRYDRLQSRIVESFESSKTFTADALASGDTREILVNSNDIDWQDENAPFSYQAPFNALSVENNSSADIAVWFDKSKETYFELEAGTQLVEAEKLAANRHFNFVAVENIDGAENISADEVLVNVGKEVDSVHLRLLEMSGLLDIGE